MKGLVKVENEIFFAGVKAEENKFLTNGGRVLNVVALGEDLDEAISKAYADIEKISFTDAYYRKDIGTLYIKP
ncbi:MAG: hypothetical protein CR959_02300 [Fusobacteriales bacterium]|nr:MAG: hypothetical protein CR959_02300 [Fusobacteriales bacterium]